MITIPCIWWSGFLCIFCSINTYTGIYIHYTDVFKLYHCSAICYFYTTLGLKSTHMQFFFSVFRISCKYFRRCGLYDPCHSCKSTPHWHRTQRFTCLSSPPSITLLTCYFWSMKTFISGNSALSFWCSLFIFHLSCFVLAAKRVKT